MGIRAIQVTNQITSLPTTLSRVGLALAVPPTNTFNPLLLPTQTGMPYTNTHNHISIYTYISGFSQALEVPFPAGQNPEILEILHHQYYIIIIRKCGSTLYVGLARTAPPTNTSFRLTFSNTTSGGSI